MNELERKEIVKELEGLVKFITCPEYVQKALSLIKELTEKVENYRNELGEVRFALAEANNDKKELTKENERLKDKLERTDRALIVMDKAHNKLFTESFKIEADTVSEIKTRFAMRYGTYTDKDMTPIAEVFRLLDKIAKEMTEGKDERT